ncbi:gamma-interferon-responsive lysosomal thiol protein isoform X1 [Malus sylvestris]|uniref:gamma-interferon-responsive lysosomal thiol protein isoform X1 n=1 Tax=Malus domestica TaxID=3750 RepID=UPI0010AABF29|nr:gamma-interferon-responsive lysosomal thiol protein isoform X1 [Malus domestica]XP_028944013.1 gamma-interferon-responsive lysosomal thiol protein isoform X1 [Malus domestica]XP_050110991.1 gamma-interferon-responsive lysosomal thiol protein isoform X1 [Malus sylvestris]
MASSRLESRTLSFSLLSCLFLVAMFTPPSSSAARTPPSDSGKVSLALYYESLCPYSANFIVNYLVKLFEDDLISIVDLKLSPWGNAKLRSNDTFTCQHGPSECLLNTVEACAIEIWPALNDHFPFIYCVESLVYEHKYPQWESCYEKLGLDSKPIAECYSSGLGKELELQYAAETSALQPPHQYVPWVVVDGQPLYEDYENFLSYVCNAYNGTTALEACSKISLNTRKSSKSTHSVRCEGNMPAVLGRIGSTIKSWIRQMNLAIWM